MAEEYKYREDIKKRQGNWESKRQDNQAKAPALLLQYCGLQEPKTIGEIICYVAICLCVTQAIRPVNAHRDSAQGVEKNHKNTYDVSKFNAQANLSYNNTCPVHLHHDRVENPPPFIEQNPSRFVPVPVEHSKTSSFFQEPVNEALEIAKKLIKRVRESVPKKINYPPGGKISISHVLPPTGLTWGGDIRIADMQIFKEKSEKQKKDIYENLMPYLTEMDNKLSAFKEIEKVPPDYINTIKNIFIRFLDMAVHHSISILSGEGDCAAQVSYMLIEAFKDDINLNNVDCISLKDVNSDSYHVFAVAGLDKKADISNVASWNNSAVLLDYWLNNKAVLVETVKKNKDNNFIFSQFNGLQMKIIKSYLTYQFPRIARIDPENPDYKKLAFTREEVIAIEKFLYEIFQHPALKNDLRELIKDMMSNFFKNSHIIYFYEGWEWERVSYKLSDVAPSPSASNVKKSFYGYAQNQMEEYINLIKENKRLPLAMDALNAKRQPQAYRPS